MRFGATHSRIRISLAVILLAWIPGAALAVQAPTDAPGADVRLLAAGWNALASGDTPAAARIAAELTSDPDARPSIAVLTFVVETAIAGSNSAAGLTAYERWLGGRSVEAPYALRHIARALLQEAAAKRDSPVRMQALGALAGDGDAEALAELAAGTARGDMDATLANAAAGDPQAVNALAKRLASQPAGAGGQERLIEALAQSGSERAVPALTAMLADGRDATLAAAAKALGRLSAREAIPELRSLLDHHYPAVRLAAAEALYRMGEDTGRQVLQAFASSEYPGVRIGAAQAMASRPDAEWETLVRGLISDDDPVIRLHAARLLAPHDAKLAGETLAVLMQDPNPAVREAAGFAAASADTADFAALRRLLRGPDQRTQVQAAGRILALTR
jgi:HEAT repeat protein